METRPFGRPRGASADDQPTAPARPKPFYRHLYFQVLARDRAGATIGHFWPELGESPQAAGRRLHQAGEDDHRAGDLPDRGDRHRRHARPGQGRPRGAEGLRYFLVFSTLALIVGLIVANVVQPGAGMNIDPATLKTRRRSPSTRPRPTTRRSSASCCTSSRHRGQRLRRGRDPAGAVLLDPVRPVAGHGRRSRPAGGDFLEWSPRPSSAGARIVMKAAPIGAFGAFAFTIGKYGIGSIANLRPWWRPST
jgi:aerobic C4-dicarboxylate transport protein